MQGRDVQVWTYSMLEGLGAGWTPSFLAELYPELSRYIINDFVRATTKVALVVILALFVIFGAENFQKIHAVLLTEGILNLRLDGF